MEVKTSETYAIKTDTLMHYVNALITARHIPDEDHALGLYVVGRPDPDLRQLENAITAERRTHRLRIVSVESLLSLAELMTEYDVSHDDVLAVLRPSRPTIDPIIDLMARLVAQRQTMTVPEPDAIPKAQIEALSPQTDAPPLQPCAEEMTYWLTSVKADDIRSAEETITTLVGTEGIYAFGEKTPGRNQVKPGDWIAFYAAGKGVVAHAQIASMPENTSHPRLRHPEKYPWVFRVEHPSLYVKEPVVIDAALRHRLMAFHHRDEDKSWAWFVQATHRVTAHDFKVLTRQEVQP